MLLQWAERLLEGGGNEQWGDKWEERFKDGKGGKQVLGLPPIWHVLLSCAVVFVVSESYLQMCNADEPILHGRSAMLSVLHLHCKPGMPFLRKDL